MLIPTTTKTNSNSYAALMYDEEDEEDDDATAIMSNCSSNYKKVVPVQPPEQHVAVESTRRQPITSPTRHKALRALFETKNVV